MILTSMKGRVIYDIESNEFGDLSSLMKEMVILTSTKGRVRLTSIQTSTILT